MKGSVLAKDAYWFVYFEIGNDAVVNIKYNWEKAPSKHYELFTTKELEKIKNLVSNNFKIIHTENIFDSKEELKQYREFIISKLKRKTNEQV